MSDHTNAGNAPTPTPEHPPRRKKRKHSKIRKILKLLLILLLIAALIFGSIALVRKFPLHDLKSWVQINLLGYSDGDGYPVPYDGNSADYGNFTVQDNSPALISDTVFLYLTGGGRTNTLRQHSFSSPAMERSGSHFLLYDLGHKSYCTSLDGITFSDTMTATHSIYCGAVASNGSYALSTDSDGYASQVLVYDSTGKQLFRWASQSYRITTLAFDATGKRIAAGGFTAENGNIRSVVEVFSLNSSEPVSSFDLQDNLLLDLQFMEDGRLAAIGDRSILLGRLDGSSVITTYSYPSTLLSFSLHHSKGIAFTVSTSGDSRRSELFYMALDGNVNELAKFETEVHSLYLSEDGILTHTDNTLVLRNFSGAISASAQTDLEVLRAIPSSNGNTVFLLSHNLIHCIDLK